MRKPAPGQHLQTPLNTSAARPGFGVQARMLCFQPGSASKSRFVQVVAAGPGDMRMFYHSFDQQQQRYVVGMATSKDGFR